MECYHYSPSETFVVLDCAPISLLGTMMARLNNKGRSHFCRKNRTFSFTTKTTKSKKLRIRDGILDM